MLRNYLIVAWKVLLRRKFFTFASLFGVAITLMVLLVAVAMLDHVFAPQSPEVHGDRTLGIYAISMKGEHFENTSPPGYGFLSGYVLPLAAMPRVEAVSIVSQPEQVVSYDRGRRISSYLRRSDATFWRMMEFRFLEGAAFSEVDAAQGRFVAVINESTRTRYFGEGKTALGRTITVENEGFRVVGVVEDVPLVRINSMADVWVPIRTQASSHYEHSFSGGFFGLILARDRADFDAIKSELTAQTRKAEKNLPDPKNYQHFSASADTVFDSIAREIFSSQEQDAPAGRLKLMMVILGFLFVLLPTVNLVNINLSRILERSSEIGVRKAFGASSRTLVGQFVVENLILTLLGGVVGLAMAAGALALVNASELIPYSDFSINARVFGYGLGLAVLFGVFSGVYPAWRMSRLHPVQALQGRTS